METTETTAETTCAICHDPLPDPNDRIGVREPSGALVWVCVERHGCENAADARNAST